MAKFLSPQQTLMSWWRDVGPNFDKDSASPEYLKKFENLQALFSVWSDGEVRDLLAQDLNELVSWWNRHKKSFKKPLMDPFSYKKGAERQHFGKSMDAMSTDPSLNWCRHKQFDDLTPDELSKLAKHMTQNMEWFELAPAMQHARKVQGAVDWLQDPDDAVKRSEGPGLEFSELSKAAKWKIWKNT